jgi:uncharacterized protein
MLPTRPTNALKESAVMSGRVFATIGFQAALAAIALVWQNVRERSVFTDGFPLGTTHAIAIPLALSLGALVGVVVVAWSRSIARNTPWGRAMHSTLREGVLDLQGSTKAIASIALATAIGEELLFRGAMFPTLRDLTSTSVAIALSSVVFGMLHVPSARSLLPWTLMACGMGAIFSLLYLLTGEVICPIMAHAVINYENMHFLLAHDFASKTDSEAPSVR